MIDRRPGFLNEDVMKLEEWCNLTKTLPTHPTTEKKAVSLIPDKEGEYYWDLWHLEDYAVSSVCGVVLWLVPRDVPYSRN